MPLDKAGKFHNSIQRAMASDKAGMPPGAPKLKKPPAAMAIAEPPPSPAAEHLRDLQAEMGGRHMHVHQGPDGALTSHQISDGGDVEGPHNHENLDALKESMDQFLEEEGAGEAVETGMEPAY